MATITSLGIGSGLDLNTIVEKLTALERRPLTEMQSTATQLKTQVSSYGKMQSLFSALQDASNALNTSSLWTGSVATSSNDSAVNATGGSNAASGTYSVQVDKLASAQTLASGAVFASSSALVGGGTLSIQLGAWDATQGVFTNKDGAAAVDIEVSDTDTLQSLRDKINASGAGISASLVTDSSGVRLSLSSKSTGAVNGFTVQSSSSDAAGLGRITYDPADGSGGGGMQLKQAAGDAQASVNGIAVVSASNTLTGVVDGLTLNLRQVTTAPVNVTLSQDSESVTKAIRTFADAYNALSSFISYQTKYDATSKTGGPLQGDSAATTLMGRLRAVLNTPSGASGSFARLSDVGLQLQRDGTLKVDAAKLSSAVGQREELQKAFSNNDIANPGNSGFARRYAQLTTAALDVDGTLTTRTEGLRKQITRNSDDQAKVNDRADRFQERLVKQYTAMDANLSKLNALSSYVTQQIAQMNKSTG
jgi:flagellar hook-associated protein 2